MNTSLHESHQTAWYKLAQMTMSNVTQMNESCHTSNSVVQVGADVKKSWYTDE